MKKTISAILLIAMLATLFSSCSLFGDNLIGTWETEIDITDLMVDGIKSSIGENADALFPALDIKDLKVKSYITFNEDGSYSASADSDSVNAMVKSLIDQIITSFEASLNAMADKAGSDKGAIPELTEQLRELLNSEFAEAAISEQTLKFSKSGFYNAEDGKLYTADTLDALEGAGYETYEISENTLTLNKGEGLEDVYSDFISDFYPLVYTKKAE